MPVYYPEGVIGVLSPCIIWYDEYSDHEKDNIKYRIEIMPENGEMLSIIIEPGLYDKYFYYKLPYKLIPDKYKYKIEKLLDSKPIDSRYFRYLKYPINGGFILDQNTCSKKDDLPPERLIEYLKLEKENRLVNRNNIFFYGSAGIFSFGIGLLFYSVLDYGIISNIIYTVAFTSSAVGLGVSGYYGYKYLKTGNSMNKLIDIDEKLSLNGSVSPDEVHFNIKTSF